MKAEIGIQLTLIAIVIIAICGATIPGFNG
jgi:hypothetical protein